MATAKRLELEQRLLWSLINQETWVIRSNLPHWLVLEVRQESDCKYIAQHFSSVLSHWRSIDIEVYFEVDRQIYQANKSGEFTMPESPPSFAPLIGGPININRSLLDAFGMMLDPERSIGLVRLSDERQISVSGGANGIFLAGASLDVVTTWRRENYWHPEDLFNFNKFWHQEMSIGSDRWLEWRYKSFDPLSHNPEPAKCDYTFITKYRLIQGPDGELFHLAENLGMEEITPTPHPGT